MGAGILVGRMGWRGESVITFNCIPFWLAHNLPTKLLTLIAPMPPTILLFACLLKQLYHLTTTFLHGNRCLLHSEILRAAIS